MLQIIEKDISQSASEALAKWQKMVLKGASVREQKEIAETLWTKASRRKVFKTEIKTVLAEMCNGLQRCGYCEGAPAQNTEHIYPKVIYPERAFVWENYLYVCANCNSKKGDIFLVFESSGSIKVRQALLEDYPKCYDSVLLNPRQENPLDYMELDLSTFLFVNSSTPGSRAWVRVDKTLEILGLKLDKDNPTAELLRKQRKNTFQLLRTLLHSYPNYCDFKELQEQILYTQHPAVWYEIKRYYRQYSEQLKNMYPDIYKLLNHYPELLHIAE